MIAAHLKTLRQPAHVEFGAGASIDWQGPSESSLLVQIQEFRLLRRALHIVTEPVTTQTVVSGLLTGASVEKHIFEMRLDSGILLQGRFGDAINSRQTAELPKRYSARIQITKTIEMATEKENFVYFLDALLSELPI
jgi:hypothetical protein